MTLNVLNDNENHDVQLMEKTSYNKMIKNITFLYNNSRCTYATFKIICKDINQPLCLLYYAIWFFLLCLIFIIRL